MCIEALHKTTTNKSFRVLFATPYENQIRLIFTRIRELIDHSPFLKDQVVRSTSSPFVIEFSNGSMITGFTTGASSGSGGASIRGQRADWLYLDEVDYMGADDFDTVTTIAAERDDIGILLSSTPTGKRSKFYEACTDKSMGYTEHHHPSTHNPNWNHKMEAEFRAQLSEQGYVHEVLAEFGTQEAGVFDKKALDEAIKEEIYAYDKLDYFQQTRVENDNLEVEYLDYDINNPAPKNMLRCVGVDFDKYQASSSIIVLDYDLMKKKFKIIKRIEVPRGEYSYDNALKKIQEVNYIYNPTWIYCDRGSSEYLIERLHIIGEEQPHTGLKNKVKGFQFSEKLDIENPVTGEVTKEHFKPFMVSQLQITLERRKLIMSPFDEVLHKQLVDYEVVRVSSGRPVFSNVNDHFVDALGLAHLAFVLEFPEIINVVQKFKTSTKILSTPKTLGENRMKENIEKTEKKTENIYNVSSHNENIDRRSFVKTDFRWSRSKLSRKNDFTRSMW